MPTKQTSHIHFELEWLEKKVQSLRDFLDAHPLEDIEDRYETFPSPKGMVVKVMATVEQQVKAYQSVLKDLPDLLQKLDDLRRRHAETEIATRGKSVMPGLMKDRLQT